MKVSARKRRNRQIIARANEASVASMKVSARKRRNRSVGTLRAGVLAASMKVSARKRRNLEAERKNGHLTSPQ